MSRMFNNAFGRGEDVESGVGGVMYTDLVGHYIYSAVATIINKYTGTHWS